MPDREKKATSEQSHHSAEVPLARLASGEATSVALVNRYFSRVAQFNKPLNVAVQQHYALALEAAARAGRKWLERRVGGVLHGLPCTVRESFDMQGWLITSDAHYLKDNWTTQDAPSIVCLRAAEAILMGKTNVPMVTADQQTYNDLYGTTRSLQDGQHSSGGPSGGAAVVVAADFTPVEFGSDLFGSLHIPARHTGVYVYRYSLGLMSTRGHVPGGGPQATDEPDLSTAGLMAHNAVGLCLTMHVLSTFWVELPCIPDSSRYQVEANYHVCAWFSAPHHEIDQRIAQHFQSSVDKLHTQPGMEINDAIPVDIDPNALSDIAVKLSGRLVSMTLSGCQRLTVGLAALGFGLVGRLVDTPGGITSYYQDMLKDNGEQWNTDKLRHEHSRVVETFLAHYDALLTPVNPMLAFAHIQQPVCKRKLVVNGEPQDYNEHLFWNMLTVVSGLPATVYPLAKTMNELPCGIQIISGYFHDDMTVDLAEFCGGISSGFMVPEGY